LACVSGLSPLSVFRPFAPCSIVGADVSAKLGPDHAFLVILVWAREEQMREPGCPVFCLIVEVDPLAGLPLANALHSRRCYVAGPFTCGREGLNWLARFTPDVAFATPTLPDGLSERVIARLLSRQVPVCHVARSSGPSRALKGVPSIDLSPVASPGEFLRGFLGPLKRRPAIRKPPGARNTCSRLSSMCLPLTALRSFGRGAEVETLRPTTGIMKSMTRAVA
jgi:hypothetical protein